MKEKCLKMLSEYRERRCNVTRDGRMFQKLAPETGNARLPTVERLNGAAAGWLEEADRCI